MLSSDSLINALLVIGTGVVQLFVQLMLDRISSAFYVVWGPRYSTVEKTTITVIAILVVMAGHLCEVSIWALRFYELGELGGIVNSFYFSLASFTTVGASELALSPAHRLAGAIEAAIGMLMFGWSTALLVKIIQRIDAAS